MGNYTSLLISFAELVIVFVLTNIYMAREKKKSR